MRRSSTWPSGLSSPILAAPSSAQWIVNSYTLAFAALLLTAGALADRLGARSGFLVGLTIFVVGSAAAASPIRCTMLIAARLAQGVGAAWLMPCSFAIITHAFLEPRPSAGAGDLGRGIGHRSRQRPVVGGILATALSWRAIFLVNVPVAIVATVLLVRHLAETRRHGHPLDPAGQRWR